MWACAHAFVRSVVDSLRAWGARLGILCVCVWCSVSGADSAATEGSNKSNERGGYNALATIGFDAMLFVARVVKAKAFE